MKHVLVPTDYSETARNAFLYALKLADTIQATVSVLHVYEPKIISGSVAPHLVDAVQQKKSEAELQILKTHVPEMEQIAKANAMEHILINYELKEGLVIPEILKFIDENPTDMIVMGTDGMNSFNKKIMGSNTINTISKVQTPILSVPKSASFQPIHTLGFTTVFSDKDEATLDRLIEMTKPKGIEIKCLHIKSFKNPVPETIIQRWKDKYKREHLSFHIVTPREVEKEIVRFIDDEKIDIVASVARNRTFLEKIFSSSVTHYLYSHIHIPICIYK